MSKTAVELIAELQKEVDVHGDCPIKIHADGGCSEGVYSEPEEVVFKDNEIWIYGD